MTKNNKNVMYVQSKMYVPIHTLTLGGQYYGNYENHDQNQRNDCQRKKNTNLSIFRHFGIYSDTHTDTFYGSPCKALSSSKSMKQKILICFIHTWF